MVAGDSCTAFDHVALLTEGVDRNCVAPHFAAYTVGSPSSRRAWIEMRQEEKGAPGGMVALLTEGVDRNT